MGEEGLELSGERVGGRREEGERERERGEMRKNRDAWR